MNQEQIFHAISGYQTSRILLTALELKIFTTIDEKKMTSEDISHKIGTKKESTETLLNALTALGFLKKHEGLFSNSPHSLQFLCEKSPDFLGGVFHSNNLWDTWSGLTDAVKTGKHKKQKNVSEHNEDWLYNFIAAMHARAKKSAFDDIEQIELTGTKSILDLGGGSGVYGMAFKKRAGAAEVTLFDLPEVIPISEKFIESEGYTGKIKTLKGNFDIDPIGSGYDLIFLSAIVHMNNNEKNIKLIKKCTEALNPNGRIVIQDYIMNEDRTDPVRGALFAVNMLVGTKGGTTYTQNEINSWFEKAGITFSKKINLPSGAAQIVGIKQTDRNL
jgi:SAM-dependent methyltransferase